MTIEGTKAGVNNTLMAVCDNISNGTTFTYSGTTVSLSTHMVVNGQTFYGVSCYSSVCIPSFTGFPANSNVGTSYTAANHYVLGVIYYTQVDCIML